MNIERTLRCYCWRMFSIYSEIKTQEIKIKHQNLSALSGFELMNEINDIFR